MGERAESRLESSDKNWAHLPLAGHGIEDVGDTQAQEGQPCPSLVSRGLGWVLGTPPLPCLQ